MAGLDPFYASMIWSYALVNDLFYKKNKHLDLPINLWGHPLSKHINKVFANSGFMTVTDLPYLQKKINFQAVQCALPIHAKSAFLCCHALQNKFGKFLGSKISGSQDVLEELITQSKNLLCEKNSEMLSLTKWEVFFGIMPLSEVEKEMVFVHMLHKCEFSKF